MNSPLTILLTEDDQSFALLVRLALRQSETRFEVTHVVRVADALKELVNGKFDLVLTDLTLPDAVQLESVEKLRAFDSHLPLIVLTSHESQDFASQALQAGTQDYIVKDLMTPQLLERAILFAIERQNLVELQSGLITELEEQQDRLNRQNQRLKQLLSTAHRFVDNVSHEFRTPLTVVREYASLMRDGVLGDISDDQAEFLDVIGCRVDDLNTMVDDMLDSSKLEAGIMGMHRVAVDPVEIVARPLAGLQVSADVRDVQLDFEPDAELPHVFCDPEKAGRVVTNLVSNAIKFCEEGSGRVRVGMTHRSDDGNVEVRVSDNGPGIDPDGLSRMFERFQQLGTSTQSSTKGFGLGLNIARELVDLNYGTIAVESEVGVGTTFRFGIPVDDWPEIVRRYATRLERFDATAEVVAIRAAVTDDHGDATCRGMEEFWQFTERQTDLIRKSGPTEWTLLVVCGPQESESVIERFKSNHAQVSRNCPRPLPDLEFSTLGSASIVEGVEAILDLACQSDVCCAS